MAIVPKLNCGFITDGGGSGEIVVFYVTTYAVLGKLSALPDAVPTSQFAETDIPQAQTRLPTSAW